MANRMDTLKENEGVNCRKGCGECYALWNRNNNLRAAPWSRNSILTRSGTKKNQAIWFTNNQRQTAHDDSIDVV
jgi:hypothetical protein